MRKKEQKLYDRMKKNAPKTAWLQRIENLVGVGIPDVHVSGPENECWVELKAPVAPKKATTRLMGPQGLNKDQINWHLKASTKAMTTYVLIGVVGGRLFLIPGQYAAAMNDMSALDLAEISVASDWDSVFRVLMDY